MPNVEKQRERLINLLKALFQLDQPDLDFGFYRIMHAKAGPVTKFLDEDLLGLIREAFGEVDEARIAEAKAVYDAARKQAVDYGAPDPAATEPVKQAKAAYDAVKDSGSNEADVYDHLYRFFERYYDNGDFMSLRYFARETDGKAAPYAIPYDGREVYLHWANRDQYYIKTSEHLSNFTFDPTQAKEFQAHHGRMLEHKPLKVHCRIVSATEGEHDNVKASEQTERYFIIHEPEPVKIEMGDRGEPELVIQFLYRPDPQKTGQEGTWRKKRVAEAAKKVKELLPELEGADDYVTVLLTPAPTEKDKDRTLLERYLNQYTARNTMDYFIHKDLGGFLRRELDFYIKNEVMRLDDIEFADAPRVESYLAKVKVLRRIAQHLIDFLAQLEDFQKKLWLKKKFVVDTQYCITLDRIPEDFYSEIAANEAQREEWVRLFSIDQVAGYTIPLTVSFIENNPNLILDTSCFQAAFRDQLISELGNTDKQKTGTLINADNFHATRLIAKKHQADVDSIYLDPPYNTEGGPILYKNNYRKSSWNTMIESRLSALKPLMCNKTRVCITIDDFQSNDLGMIGRSIFGEDGWLGTVAIRSNPSGRPTPTGFGRSHEYAYFFALNSRLGVDRFPRSDKQAARYKEKDSDGAYMWELFRKRGSGSERSDRQTLFYPIYSKNGALRVPQMEWIEDKKYWAVFEDPESDEEVFWPIDEDGLERRWRGSPSGIHRNPDNYCIKLSQSGSNNVYYKFRPSSDGVAPTTSWVEAKYSATEHGTNVLNRYFKRYTTFSFPKSVFAVIDCLIVCGARNDEALVVDMFGGSGTTAHAVIEMNRNDNGARKFILAEAESYFDLVLKPRVLKVAYSANWEDGFSADNGTGISQFIHIIRLESYEDVLNNLALKSSIDITQADKTFARDYMLRYWLDFETKGSPSLLNIEWFDDPTAYKVKIKKPGTDEYVDRVVDLVETFNWLLGLHVEHLDRWRCYDGTFKREVDPELPEDTNTRQLLDGALKETDDGTWHFRKVEGYTLNTPGDHNDRENVLVVWRKLTGNLEQDNLMLDEWFQKYRLSTKDTEFDVIYVNGSNNLPNLRKDEDTWKVRLIEEAFHQAMWDIED